MKYIYQTLQVEHRQLRLLEVLPSADSHALLSCRLHNSSVAEQPEYETISYTWGNSEARAIIEVDGATLDVPASSDAAVRRMRLPDRPRTLWIDAICINQSNIQERGQQVSMMGDIYRNSTGNLVFLGEGNESNERALRDIDAIVSEMDEDTDNLRTLWSTLYPSGYVGFATSGLRAQVDYEALLRFFSLPWFSRLWVLQEVILAPNNTCFLGPLQWSLMQVFKAARWLEHKFVYLSNALSVCNGRLNAANMWDFAEKEYGFYKDQKPSMANLLQDSNLLEVSDRRDRVFGLLGLKQWQDGLPMLLTPNYQKSEADIFRDATRYALEEEGELWVWMNISLRSTADMESALSWVPLWSRAWSTDEDPDALASFFRCHYINGRSLDVKFQECLDLDVLEISGFPVAEVESLSTVCSFKYVEVVQDWFQEILHLQSSVALNDKEFETTLIADTNHRTVKATEEDISAFAEFERILLREERWPTPQRDISSETDEAERSASQYAQSCARACDQRRAFTTKSGYIGLGPKLMQRGDIFVVLYGGHVPYVLRPSGDEYRLLGECYVHGIMYGEAMEEHKKNGRPDTWFRIR